MAYADDPKFDPIILPDVSNVDATKITKTVDIGPKWMYVAQGLNLEGVCKNKMCEAYKMNVWSQMKCGKFLMGETVYKCPCPICGVATKGNKKIGLYKCVLNGHGMKSPNVLSGDNDTDDESEETNSDSVEIIFREITTKSGDGFLKLDGINGKMVKWRYMTLNITKP